MVMCVKDAACVHLPNEIESSTMGLLCGEVTGHFERLDERI